MDILEGQSRRPGGYFVHRLGSVLGLQWPHGRVSHQGQADEWEEEGQTAGGDQEGGVGSDGVLVKPAKKLTICGLHDTRLVVVAPGDASHRGHLGPLRVARLALRQPRHIRGRRVVICGEWGGRGEDGGGCGGREGAGGCYTFPSVLRMSQDDKQDF